jgi:hypothetical protein
VTIVHEDSPEKFTLVGNIVTKPGAKTIALDPATHRAYLSTAQYAPPPSPSAENPKPRPSVLPGTFEILVLER